jgi:hypothetical protein
MARRFLSVVTLLMIMLGVAVQPAVAAAALPPLPPQAVRDYVLSQTNGAQFTPIGTPTTIQSQLVGFNGPFDGVENLVDYSQAVHYITSTGKLTETVIPLRNSGSHLMRPNLTTPDGFPGKIIGVLFQPSRGVMVIVGTYKSMPGGTGAAQPDKIRFYSSSTQFTAVSYNWGSFVDINNDNQLEAFDEGAVIADEFSCVAVGLKQLCWDPYSYATVREGTGPKTLVTNAFNHLRAIYNFNVDFYIKDSVPDLLGRTLRQQCAAQISSATSFNSLSSCTPSVVFSASKTLVSGQPIAIMVVQTSADVRTYDTAGYFIGALPAGEYLVMDAMPQLTQSGQASLLFLVNADGVHHYLIPSTVQQGYGQSTAIDERYAGIRDGLMSWRGVGY